MIRLEPPRYEVFELAPKRSRYRVLVTTLNEADRIRGQLERMRSRAELAIVEAMSHGGSRRVGLPPGL